MRKISLRINPISTNFEACEAHPQKCILAWRKCKIRAGAAQSASSARLRAETLKTMSQWPSWRSRNSSRSLQSIHLVTIGRASNRRIGISQPQASQ